jgi:hypothetical protein
MTIMKKLRIALGLSVLTSSALAGIPVGRGDITVDATATSTYDSNVYGSPNAIGDYSGTFTPHAAYTRKAGEIEADASVGISLERYLDQTQLNSDNLDADANLKLSPDPGRNLSGTLGVAYHENSDVNTDINARIKSKTATFSGTGALITGPRTDLALEADYSNVHRDLASDQQLLGSQARFDYKDFFDGNSLRLIANYDAAQSSGQNARGADLDQNSYSIAAGLGRTFYHNVIQAGISYGYRVLNRSQAETASGVTRQSGPVLTASLEGPFLPERYFPKIKSRLELSYEDATTPGVNDTGGKELTGGLHLDWQARSTTVASFSAIRSQRLSADDLTVVSSVVQLGLDQTFRYNLTGYVTTGYEWNTYRGAGRSDETVLFTAGLKYVFARSWNAGASYRLTSATSDQRSAQYDRQIVSLSVAHQF